MEITSDDLTTPLNPVNRGEGEIIEEITEEGESSRVSEIEGQDIAICHLRMRGMPRRNAESLENTLKMFDGVRRVVVGLAMEEAKVHFDTNLINEPQILEIVENAGFEVELITAAEVNKVHIKLHDVSFDDMTKIRTSLQQAVGVNSVGMDMSQQIVSISYDPNQTGARSLMHCIQEAGQGLKNYSASLFVPPSRRHSLQLQEIHTYRNLLLFSCLFSVPVVLFTVLLPMLSPYGDWLDYRAYNMVTIGMLLKWIFCTPIQFIVGLRFYLGSYRALRQISANMDVLIALGTNATYLYSVYIVLKAFSSTSCKGQDLFETSSMLISFILLEKYLEAVAKGKTSDALAKLARLAPDRACLLTLGDNGIVSSEMEIDTQLLQRNDIIKIVPGAKVPVDGIVISGRSHVDESTISGESRFIVKITGDKVVGGTDNENGSLIVKVTHVGADTTLSQIAQLVESVQLSRVPAQKFTYQISNFFVPVVVVVASVTWLGWLISGKAGIYPKHWIPKAMDEFDLGLQFGISVLLIACPCAFGLATPTAVMVASQKAASLGVLFKGPKAFQNAYEVKTVVFEKTGTLTLGRPEVVNVVPFNNFSMLVLCTMAMAMESDREHPLAKSLAEYAKEMEQMHGFRVENPTHIEDFVVFPGGVGGKIDEHPVLVGNRRLLYENDVHFGNEVDQYIGDNDRMAQTFILMSIDGVVAAGFDIIDPLKPGAKAVISYLRSNGISSIMVTGAADDKIPSAAIAKELGINTVFHEIYPVEKANRIKELKMRGEMVAMVGNGVNESSVLAAADIGIAIGAGADIAMEAADIVLMRTNIEDVVTAIDISRQTIRRIWMNYIWAFGYNIITVPIAAGILFPFTGFRLPPWLAGACMAASSLIVLCFPLSLNFYRNPLNFQSAGQEIPPHNSSRNTLEMY